MPRMQSQSSRHRAWRHFVRHNRNLFFAGFILLFVLAFVVVLFVLLTKPELLGRH